MTLYCGEPSGKDLGKNSRVRKRSLKLIMLNHWYHLRGQLSVYLRLLDVPVPASYGRSADQTGSRKQRSAGSQAAG
jgi:uncharacterized damage-inducible protein DinB